MGLAHGNDGTTLKLTCKNDALTKNKSREVIAVHQRQHCDHQTGVMVKRQLWKSTLKWTIWTGFLFTCAHLHQEELVYRFLHRTAPQWRNSPVVRCTISGPIGVSSLPHCHRLSFAAPVFQPLHISTITSRRTRFSSRCFLAVDYGDGDH